MILFQGSPSMELKPFDAHSIIEIGLPKMSVLKVMKNLARRDVGKNTPVEPKVIETLVKREQDKLLVPLKIQEENHTTAYWEELRTFAQRPRSDLESKPPTAAQNALVHKINDFRKERVGFLSLIGET